MAADRTALVRRIDVGGSTLHVRDEGAGEPVLVLHGFAGSARVMAPLTEVLAEHHRVIAPDLVGHGRSDAPTTASAYAWPAVTRGLVRLLDALDVPHAHVLGFSLGGRIALQLAARHEERVRAVVTIGSRCTWQDDAERAARRASDAALAARIDTAGFVATFRDHGADEDQLAIAVPLAGAHGLALTLRGLGAADQPEVGAALARSALPLLLVAGSEDRGPLAAAHALAADLPCARVAEIAGAGHRAHLARPHEVARLALDFFAGVAGAPVRFTARRARHAGTTEDERGVDPWST